MASSVRDEGLIISIKEARKILGAQYAYCSDTEIEALVQQIDFMAGVAIKRVVPKTGKVD